MPTDNIYFSGGAPAPLTRVANKASPQNGVHLYHFPLSLYSQKVRQALIEKGIAWESQIVMLPFYGNYEPEYVRINNRCVVPCLVEDGCVTTDSDNIISMLDREYDKGSLTPSDPNERAMMPTWVANAERIFVEAITYSNITPEGVADCRPVFLRKLTRGSTQHKIDTLHKLAEKHADDNELHTAYVSMIKVKKFANETIYDREAMNKIFEATKIALKALHLQLCDGPFSKGGYLISPTFSQADIHWGAVLNRLNFLGIIGTGEGAKAWGCSTKEVMNYLEK